MERALRTAASFLVRHWGGERLASYFWYFAGYMRPTAGASKTVGRLLSIWSSGSLYSVAALNDAQVRHLATLPA